LNDATLYVVFESSEKTVIDSVICNEKGQFHVYHEQDDDLQAITFYYNERAQWFTVYPEPGKTIHIKGDANYPLLLQIKGGRINNKLSQFKKKIAPLLKELTDKQRNELESASLTGDETMQLPNLRHELREAAQDFISKNPKEEASAFLIYEHFADPNAIEQTENLLQLLSPELDDFHLVKNIRKEIEKAKTTKAGAKAPDFNVTDIYGQTFAVDSFANKYFILAFTALWCDMCQTEEMALDDISSKYAKDSLEILLVSLDNELDDMRKKVRQDSARWHLVVDSAGQAIRLFEAYNVNSLPKCFLMDKDGTILLNTKNEEELRQMVEEIMELTPH
jgi:peroxiredoxin